MRPEYYISERFGGGLLQQPDDSGLRMAASHPEFARASLSGGAIKAPERATTEPQPGKVEAIGRRTACGPTLP